MPDRPRNDASTLRPTSIMPPRCFMHPPPLYAWVRSSVTAAYSAVDRDICHAEKFPHIPLMIMPMAVQEEDMGRLCHRPLGRKGGAEVWTESVQNLLPHGCGHELARLSGIDIVQLRPGQGTIDAIDLMQMIFPFEGVVHVPSRLAN